YPCCSSVNPEVVYTDEGGNTWGYEDGQWCGIVPTSTSEPILDCYAKTGYPCCASELTEIISTDESGNWGYENGDWC
ncbi:Non-catalytic module family DOC2, partial [Piromyces sp. E2]